MMGIYQSLHDHVKMIMGAFTAIPNKTLPVLFSPKACMPIPFMIEVRLTIERNDPMMNYPAAEQRGSYKGNETPQAAGY